MADQIPAAKVVAAAVEDAMRAGPFTPVSVAATVIQYLASSGYRIGPALDEDVPTGTVLGYRPRGGGR